ncbi:hypothetical protein T265_11869 [Opisthorchis viverrini]|uniref:Uncharacterized protein n=1 Tax=Opisthorchis viverrini TaxID=6198 RepID=A0A074YWZ2_OPIVI|nr:hypothetical protein T265_11869 [Opisthorchis viverrini]KER19326.1 hypothetical protein T265_11869 [Opisthorchis viverrini]
MPTDTVAIGGNTKEQHDLNQRSFSKATRNIAQWVAEVHKPPHHGRVQPLRDGITINDNKTVTASKAICLLGYEFSKGVISPTLNARSVIASYLLRILPWKCSASSVCSYTMPIGYLRFLTKK